MNLFTISSIFLLASFLFPAMTLSAPAQINLCSLVGLTLETASTDLVYLAPEQLLDLMKRKKDILIVDARPEDNFEYEHIRGAVNLPWATQIKEPAGLPRHKRIIVYCDCSAEETSIDVARQLINRFGYSGSNILILKGGLERWKELGYPMDR